MEYEAAGLYCYCRRDEDAGIILIAEDRRTDTTRRVYLPRYSLCFYMSGSKPASSIDMQHSWCYKVD